jgi:hypothetical protein
MAGFALPLLVVLAVSGQIPEPPQTTPRKPAVGIISPPALQRSADVLTAVVSSDSTLTLLERNEIGRILTEQRLSAGGLASKDYARIGGLLKADGLVFLETATVNSLPVLTVRVVAAGPGVVVGASFDKNPPEDLHKWAREIADRLHVLAPKLSVAAGEAVPISVLNLRSTLPTRAARDLERELTTLLIHRLANEPRLFVLERAQMDKLNFEKFFTEGSPQDFWASSYVVDGEIEGTSTNTLSVKLRLERHGQGPQALQVEGRASDLPGLAESLAKRLLQQLGQDSLVTAWQPREEGQRFYAEAKSAFDAGLLEVSLPAAEASQILGFDSVLLRTLLLNLYAVKSFKVVERSPIKSAPAENVDLNSALRGLDLYSGLLKEDVPVRWVSQGRALYDLGPSMLWGASRVVRWYRENGLYPSNQADLDFLRRRLRAVAQFILDKGGTNATSEFYCVMACYAPYWYDEPNQVLQAYDKVLAPHFNNYPYAISWVRHHLTAYRDQPNLFGTSDLQSRIPWLIDWTGSSQGNLDELWRDFVQSRVQAPVLNDRLDGWMLAYYSTNSPGVQAAIAGKAATDLWTNRDAVLRDPVTLGISTRLLSDLSFDEDLRFQLLNYYLGKSSNIDFTFLGACFGSGFTNRAHATTLYQSMKVCDQRLGLSSRDLRGQYNDFRGLQESLAHAFPELREPSSAGMRVTLSWPPVVAARTNPTALPSSWNRQVQYALGAIWVSADEVVKDGFQTVFTRVELPTIRTTARKAPFTIPGPNGGAMENFSHAFAVGEEWLFWVNEGRLARCHLGSGRWDEIEVPAARFPILKYVNGFLYYAFPSQPLYWAYEPETSGILKIDPRTMKIDVLASSRRKPAKSRLDDVPAYFVYDLFAGPGNHLYASICSGRNPRTLAELYRFSETEKEWTLAYPEVAYNFVPYRAVQFSGGNVVQPIGWPLERAFILYQDGTLEFLFPDRHQLRKPFPTRWPNQLPLWEHAPWNPVVATLDGNDLWILGPRITTEPAPLNLYLYSKGSSERKAIPLYFPSANTDNYPTRDSGPVQLLATPQGLVIAGTKDTAFWFLPKQDLETFVASTAQTDRTPLSERLPESAMANSPRTNAVPHVP